VIEFTPLTQDDLPQIEQWLRREHVSRWWRDPIEESLAEYPAGIGGREATDYSLIVLDGRPIGMIQSYLVSDYQEPNRRSWRAFEKAGFRHVRHVEEDGLPHRLMRLDR
jgi:Acetyltransferase (GNAT) domain